MRQTVELEEGDWQKVLGILATAPWSQANPLIMAIGQQLMPKPDRPPRPETEKRARVDGDGAKP